MVEQKSIHEPGAQLLNAQDAIEDAGRLRALLLRNRQQAKREGTTASALDGDYRSG